jgi:hypothetical protein
MTMEPACGNTHAMPRGTIYEHVLRIKALVQATDTLVNDHVEIADGNDGPAAPITALLEMAVDELNSLTGRVSD